MCLLSDFMQETRSYYCHEIFFCTSHYNK